MDQKEYMKLVTFVRKLSKPKIPKEILYKNMSLTEERGDTAVDIFIDGTDFMEAEIALEARELLKEIKMAL